MHFKVRITIALLFFLVYGSHAHDLETNRVQIELEKRGPIDAGPHTLEFQLLDRRSEDPLEPKNLKEEHAKLLHLFVFDQVLENFQHLHPLYEDPVWKVELPLTENGNYRIWVQGLLTTGEEFAAVTTLAVRNGPTKEKPSRPFAETREATDGGVRVTLNADAFFANAEGEALFVLNKTNGSKVNLKPYLGENAHVIITNKEGSSLLHAHAVSPGLHFQPHSHNKPAEKPVGNAEPKPDSTEQSLLVHVDLPRPDRYRAWLQFVEGNELHTIAFDIKALPSRKRRLQEPNWLAPKAKYVPASTLTWDEYSKLSQKYEDMEVKGRSEDGLQDFYGATERAILPALISTFSSPSSLVTFSDFTLPSVRHEGKYFGGKGESLSRDESAGLRVVWFDEYPNPGNPEEKLMVSIILFYDYDRETGELVLITEEDAMRGRVEIKRMHHGEGFMNISYVIKTNGRSGNVVEVEPGIYVRNDGSIKDPLKRFNDFAQPEHCGMCHSNRTYLTPRLLDEASENNFARLSGPRDFVKYLLTQEINPIRVQNIQAKLKNPKRHFCPPGLVQKLQERLDRLNSEAKRNGAPGTTIKTGAPIGPAGLQGSK